MSLFKNIFILSLSFFLFSCGGGGGGSSASPVAAAPAAPTYSYDKTAHDYTNKSWGIDTQMRRHDKNDGISFAGFGSFPISVSVLESEDYINITLSGTTNDSGSTETFNYDFQLDSTSTVIEPLYDPSGTEIIAYLFGNSFSNAVLAGLIFDEDYLASLNVEYTNVGFLDFYFDDYRDTFAINYGDKTETGDMPTAGSANYGIAGQLILTTYESLSSLVSLVAQGTGSLTADFSSNSISGSLDFTKYYGYMDFLEAGATSQTQILGVPTATIDFFDGSISGNHFTTSTSVSTAGLSGSGLSQGSFFGPDGQETSGTFLLSMDSETDTSGLNGWEMVGTFFGTCKPGNC